MNNSQHPTLGQIKGFVAAIDDARAAGIDLSVLPTTELLRVQDWLRNAKPMALIARETFEATMKEAAEYDHFYQQTLDRVKAGASEKDFVILPDAESIAGLRDAIIVILARRMFDPTVPLDEACGLMEIFLSVIPSWEVVTP